MCFLNCKASVPAHGHTRTHTPLYLHAHTCKDMRAHTHTCACVHAHTHAHTVSLFRSPVKHLPFRFEIALRDVLSL